MNGDKQGTALLMSYCYCTGAIEVPSGAGQTKDGYVIIGSDADFRCHFITITVLQANVVVTTWGGTIEIKDASPGRLLMDKPVPVDALRGEGGRPYRYDPPRLFTMSTTLSLHLTNNVATATTVYVVFHGNKFVAR